MKSVHWAVPVVACSFRWGGRGQDLENWNHEEEEGKTLGKGQREAPGHREFSEIFVIGFEVTGPSVAGVAQVLALTPFGSPEAELRQKESGASSLSGR